MTTITVSERSVKASGHAGYANAGNDIVCAGISTLMFTLYSALANENIPVDADGEQPDMTITAFPEAEQENTCTAVINTVVQGLKLLAESYPEYIKITYQEDSNGNFD